MEYKLVCTMDSHELETKVNELLRKGWEVLGGVKIAPNSNGCCRFIQSMIKKDYSYHLN